MISRISRIYARLNEEIKSFRLISYNASFLKDLAWLLRAHRMSAYYEKNRLLRCAYVALSRLAASTRLGIGVTQSVEATNGS